MGTSLSTEVLIDAPARDVWAVLLDFDAYGEWNPAVVEIEVEEKEEAEDMVVGDFLRVTTMFKGRRRTTNPRVLDVRPDRELRWEAQAVLPGCFTGERSFLLLEEDVRDGLKQRVQTRLMHGEHFQGCAVGAVWCCLEAALLTESRKNFEAFNAALKRRVEGLR